MKTFILAFLAILLLNTGTAEAELRNISNAQLTLLRVHNMGTGFGPNGDQIDVEVVAKFAGHQGAFGFQLRNDQNRLVRQGMLDLLRDAFNNNWRVNIDYEIRRSNDVVIRRNGVIIRLWLTKP